MANPQHFPLQERIPIRNTFRRLADLTILFLLLSLLSYRFATLRTHGHIWLAALLCESWFAFYWLLTVNAKWNPTANKTYPEQLSKRFDDLPAVDMFITTADPTLEPPIVTVNTMLSMLAVDYPADRLACYVSDDGGSPVTYYALCEASKFAKLWVPFCKKYNVRVRAPFVYFSNEPEPDTKLNFMREWKQMKSKYEELARKIEGGSKSFVPNHMDDELAEFSNIERGNHPSIIKVISEKKKGDDIPHLIYVAREKRPKHPHHFKAGAMNVLTKVSGVMTNAPFMLNVDCDMFVNNPEVILHGMCLLLGFDKEVMSGFVQAPQKFYGALKDDPFGNQLVALNELLGKGMAGIQGPIYGGTGCFHRRKIIYGASPARLDREVQDDELSYEELRRIYGNSKGLIESAEIITSQRPRSPILTDLSNTIAEAKQVSACTYESNTCWGKEIGWIYGSMTEDVLTGLRIHAKGWRSAYLNLEPPAFLGNAPTGGPSSLTQYKRWTTGLLEILFGPNSPVIATLTKQLEFRQALAYLLICVWGLCPISEFCYALLPAYCLLTNSSFLPKASSPEFLLPVTLFILFHIYTLGEYLWIGLSARAWWNNQRMQRISSLTAFLFGLLSVILKFLGISETIFEVTRKDQNVSDDADADPGRFTFDSSPFFVPGTALVLVNIAALGIGTVRAIAGGDRSCRLGELACSAWFLLCFWPFVRGLFGKGSYGIPWDVLRKAVVLGSIFLHFCWLAPVS